tara:strand:+ start:169 stop:609 length:441 start_codon:yes stop_codon:yes gene_type:complete
MQNYLFVCYANYCRSPVAEKIFNSFKISDINASSAGLIDFKAISMDKRSKIFLNQIKIKETQHIPRKITQTKINNSDQIFALDFQVYQELFQKYKISSNKLKLINFFVPKVFTNDPYKFNNIEEYNLCMKNIYICLEQLKSNANKL